MTECCRLPARRCVLPGVVEPSVAARACALIDDILGPRGEAVAPGVDEGGSGQYQTSKAWPPPGSRLPTVLSGDYRHSILHPIPDPVMAELTVALVDVNAELLDCPPR